MWLGNILKIVGDDLYVTNAERIRKGVQTKATNASLIKPNQIGTVTETIEAIRISKQGGLEIVSHRSGETEDTFISHIAAAVEASFIKGGAPSRGERTAKYNELLRIEEELGTSALFAGPYLPRSRRSQHSCLQRRQVLRFHLEVARVRTFRVTSISLPPPHLALRQDQAHQ